MFGCTEHSFWSETTVNGGICVKTCVNDSIASGGRRKEKPRRLFSCVWEWERRGAGRGGEMERRGEGLRCESAHTGNFIEGNKRALRTEV